MIMHFGFLFIFHNQYCGADEIGRFSRSPVRGSIMLILNIWGPQYFYLHKKMHWSRRARLWQWRDHSILFAVLLQSPASSLPVRLEPLRRLETPWL